MRRAPIYLVFAAVLVLGGGAYGTLGGVGGDPGALQSAQAKQHHASRLTISGHIKDLYPGDPRRIQLRLKNRRPHPVRVRWVKARARHGASGCSKHNLRSPKRRYRAHKMYLRPDETRHTRLRIELRGTAPEACQRVRFPLRFRVELRVNARH